MIRSRAKNDRQNGMDTKATIVSVVGEKQNCKQCAQKESSQVDGWLSSVVCAGPLYLLRSLLAESAIFSHVTIASLPVPCKHHSTK